jgi:hypothetical protein
MSETINCPPACEFCHRCHHKNEPCLGPVELRQCPDCGRFHLPGPCITDPPIKVKGEVKLKAYTIISDAIEQGLNYGWNRAYKHLDKDQHPEQAAMVEAMHNAVTNELCEILDFGDE